MKIGKSAQEQLDEFYTTLEPRIAQAVQIAADYTPDAAHHMQYAVDQMLRALLTEEQYKAFVAAYQGHRGEEGELEWHEWDQGIAP